MVLRINAAEFSPDGQYLACVTNHNQLHVYNATSWAGVHVSTGKYDIAFSANGKLMAVVAMDHHSAVRILEVGSFRELNIFRGAGLVALSPEGDSFASIITGAEDRDFQIACLANTATGDTRVLTAERTHLRLVNALAFSPSGEYLACAYAEGPHLHGSINYLMAWRLGNLEQPPLLLQWRKRVSHIVFSADSKYIVSSCTDGTITLQQCGTFEETQKLAWEGAEISRLAISRSHLVAVAQGSFRIWSAA